MQVVIIEDETVALEQLKILLKEYKELNIEIIATIDSIEESIRFFSSTPNHSIDLVFMDIHLSDGSAFSIFKHVQIDVPIIFTTAYDKYALKSFEVNCLDYILKPMTKDDLERVFKKMNIIALYGSNITQKQHAETILSTERWQTYPLEVKNIAFFYTFDFKVRAFCINKKSYAVNMTLEHLSKILNSDNFMRINRQFIIARQAVKNFESYDGSRLLVNLHLASPEKIIISRSKVKAFKLWLIKN